MDILNKIRNYVPYNEQEERDKEVLIDALKKNDDIFLRSNKVMHFTASSVIVNEDFSRVVLLYHNIYQSYGWCGGHADGDMDLLNVAIKECHEETGIENVKPYNNDLLSLEVLCVDGHVKNKEYVSSHLHLNVTYLLIASELNSLRIKADENSAVKWFMLDDLKSRGSEKWMNENIYKKLYDKIMEIKKTNIRNA